MTFVTMAAMESSIRSERAVVPCPEAVLFELTVPSPFHVRTDNAHES